jgi:energy-coupling factor transporter ATP-binding protein EcfA2
MSTFILKGIQVSFEHSMALEIDDLEIPVNGMALVTGPNGAGKTTLLRMLAGLHPPNRGTLRYKGEDVFYGRKGLPHRRRVTLVAQDPVLFRKNVLANVAFGVRARGFKSEIAAARALEALKMMGCEHLAERRASALSGGELRRVALARALATGAETLLLDEPTAGVDAENSERLQQLIASLASSGRGIVICTHQPEWAESQAQFRMRLHHGRIVSVT